MCRFVRAFVVDSQRNHGRWMDQKYHRMVAFCDGWKMKRPRGSPRVYTPKQSHGKTYRPGEIKCDWCQYGERPKNGVCDKCALAFKRLLQSKRWQKFRRAFLSEHPYCIECKPKLVPATDLDHTKPWRYYPDLFWDEAYISPLCHSHHSKKTFMDNGGIGRHHNSYKRRRD